MKNKSLKYPFPTLEDKIFDSDKDGSLNSGETMFRDMHLDEMSKKHPPHVSDSKSAFVTAFSNILAIIALVPTVILGLCFLLLSFKKPK